MIKRLFLGLSIFLIAVFLVLSIVAHNDVDYKEIVKGAEKSSETSAVLSEGGIKPEEGSKDNEEQKKEVIEQLRELGYLA